MPFVATALVVALVAAASAVMPERTEIVPKRTDFSTFPLSVGEWQGKGQRMEQIFVDTLKFDDYILADFANRRGDVVNFYVAYYGSQRKGQSAHSPRTCIPGGGWEISAITNPVIDGAMVAGHPLQVNRTLIQMGEERQLVYYWFQQRGRLITNEYLVKWYLVWDAITRNRSDGSLVRVTTIIPPDKQWSDGDAALQQFLASLGGTLDDYVPR